MKRLNIIGPEVKKLRNRRGWSQSELAMELYVDGMDFATRGKICKIEAREVRVSDEDLFYLSRALGVPADDLYPEKIRNAKNAHAAIAAAKASRHGI
ncbi:MAG TPA: helix-turn-helix transcriptional regulator [Terrimicrobiaceae bacterium]